MDIDLIRGVWILLAFVGVVVSAYGLDVSRADLRAARSNGTNGPRRMVAWTALRREAIRFCAHNAFFLAGIAAATTLPRTLIILCLIAGSALITLESLVDRIERRRLDRYLAHNPSPPEGTPTVS